MSPNKNQAFRPDGRRRADGRFITDGAGALEESPPSARLFPPSGSTGAGSFLGVTFAFVFGKDLAFAFGSSAPAVSAFFFGSALAFDFPVGSDFSLVMTLPFPLLQPLVSWQAPHLQATPPPRAACEPERPPLRHPRFECMWSFEGNLTTVSGYSVD